MREHTTQLAIIMHVMLSGIWFVFKALEGCAMLCSRLHPLDLRSDVKKLDSENHMAGWIPLRIPFIRPAHRSFLVPLTALSPLAFFF